MNKIFFLALLSSFLPMTGYCLSIHPKANIQFFCSEDKKELMVSDGTTTSTVEDNLLVWDSGIPEPGCTQQIVDDVTQKGFYCDGHFLTDYQGQQETQGTSEACQAALDAKPAVQWN